MRAMLTMHSRRTASATWRNSMSSGPDLAGASRESVVGTIMPTSCSSRLSSTLMSVAAMRSNVPSLAVVRCVTMLCRSFVSAWTLSRSSPKPRTPSVSAIFFSSSSCGASSSTCVPPWRTKMSSASFTRLKSSLIAAATVFINLTEGADKLSRACST